MVHRLARKYDGPLLEHPPATVRQRSPFKDPMLSPSKGSRGRDVMLCRGRRGVCSVDAWQGSGDVSSRHRRYSKVLSHARDPNGADRSRKVDTYSTSRGSLRNISFRTLTLRLRLDAERSSIEHQAATSVGARTHERYTQAKHERWREDTSPTDSPRGTAPARTSTG